jgi:hep_Hag family protein
MMPYFMPIFLLIKTASAVFFLHLAVVQFYSLIALIHLGSTQKNYAVSTKIGNGLTFDGNGAVMLDKNLTTDTISVGGIALTTKGIDAGSKAIGNVGAGQIAPESRDAVNGGQMYQIVNLLGNHHAQINGNTQNIQGLRQEVSRIDGKISQMDKQLKRGLSVAGAI